jgi:RNA polymerase sigma-70 factor, ECF subfamily
MLTEDHSLGKRIIEGDNEAFSIVFRHYYVDFVLFAATFVKNRQAAEEIVEEVFIRLWENRETIVITTSLRSYLLRSIQNRCIDFIRHVRIMDEYQINWRHHPELLENDTENYILHSELEEDLKKALGKIPEEVRTVFTMNRFEGMTYAEIALKLDVSVRTVEVRIGKALSLLKHYLKDYLITILLIFII